MAATKKGTSKGVVSTNRKRATGKLVETTNAMEKKAIKHCKVGKRKAISISRQKTKEVFRLTPAKPTQNRTPTFKWPICQASNLKSWLTRTAHRTGQKPVHTNTGTQTDQNGKRDELSWLL